MVVFLHFLPDPAQERLGCCESMPSQIRIEIFSYRVEDRHCPGLLSSEWR